MEDMKGNSFLNESYKEEELLDITVSSKVVEFPLGALRIVCKDGYPYDFTPWNELSPIVPLLAVSFNRSLSKHGTRKNARAANSTRFGGFKRFLEWWSGSPSHLFGRRLLLEYKRCLKSKYAAMTVYSSLSPLLSACTDLMKRGDIPAFVIPENVKQAAALQEGKGGQTLAHHLPAGS